MKLEEIGEHALISRFASRFSKNHSKALLKGIGDDCAVIERGKDVCELVTIDSQVEGVHFIKGASDPEDIGYKALAINLSDIAAMGGTPSFAFLSLALPARMEVKWVDRFFDGLQSLADIHQVALAGGNTSESPEGIFIDICVIGKASRSSLKLRSSAKEGDVLCITGVLGNSAAGLKILERKERVDGRAYASLVGAYHRPRPHVEEGAWLGSSSAVHAMIDVSDGLASDIVRLKEQSRVGFSVNLSLLPLSKELRGAAVEFGWDPLQLAFGGGEDFCLMLTVDPLRFSELEREFRAAFGRPLYKIGEAVSLEEDLIFHADGKAVNPPAGGYDHFCHRSLLG